MIGSLLTVVEHFMDQLQIAVTFGFGLLFQLFFLLLPVNLRNWTADQLNILTYLAMQSFAGGVLFFILPTVIGVYSLSWSQGGYLFLCLNTAAFLRVVWKIPLERSYPVTSEVEAVAPIVFNDVYSEEKMLLLDAASAQVEANSRVDRIRSQLVRVNPERQSLIRGGGSRGR